MYGYHWGKSTHRPFRFAVALCPLELCLVRWNPKVSTSLSHQLKEFETVVACANAVTDSFADQVRGVSCCDSCTPGVILRIPVISDPKRPSVILPVSDHMTGLRLTKMLQRILVRTTEHCSTNTVDLIDFKYVIDFNRFAKPSVCGNSREFRVLACRSTCFESNRLGPTSTLTQDFFQEWKLVYGREIAQHRIVGKPVPGHDERGESSLVSPMACRTVSVSSPIRLAKGRSVALPSAYA